jgi:translocation and assembly module TamA
MHNSIVFLLLLFLPLFGEESNETNRSYSLFDFSKDDFPSHEIHFKGQKHFEEQDLQDALGVDYRRFFQFWKEDRSAIKDKLLPTLEESMQSFYVSEGFYKAKFEIKTTDTAVSVTIQENEPVVVDDINISSDFDIAPLVTFKKGAIFRSKEFVTIKSNIIEKMLKSGYCSYDLDSKAFVDIEKNEVDIHFVLRKGGVCTFGKVNTAGLQTIDEKVVLSRVRAVEGERFSTERVKESYDSLYGLDAFDSVNINIDRKFYNVVPVDIVVSEVEKPYDFRAGVGYDTNVGPRVQAEIARKNFMGNAQKVTFRATYSAIEQLAEISYVMPALFDVSGYYIDLGGKAGYSYFEYDGFTENNGYAKLFLSYANEQLRLIAGLGAEDITIELLDNFDESLLTQAIKEGDFLLVYPYAQCIYDARDSKLNPKYGYYIAASIEYGLPYDDEASSYTKSTLEGRVIHSFGDLTLAAVTKAGVIEEAENELPESKLFFGGGSFSNRAYGYNQIGVILSRTEYGINGAYTMANLSLEADYPIVGDLYGAVFTDNTMLSPESHDFGGEVITAAGLGVRYMTPIGPFKLDVGMNVEDTTQYGIVFQIGQSF